MRIPNMVLKCLSTIRSTNVIKIADNMTSGLESPMNSTSSKIHKYLQSDYAGN